MSGTKTVESSFQLKDHVLCKDCEQRFNENGEKWVLSQMSREKRFPLQETLRKATPMWIAPGLKAYATATIPEIDVDKLEYFALSVFWRAAVHDWRPVHEEKYERLRLGPYQS